MVHKRTRSASPSGCAAALLACAWSWGCAAAGDEPGPLSFSAPSPEALAPSSVAPDEAPGGVSSGVRPGSEPPSGVYPDEALAGAGGADGTQPPGFAGGAAGDPPTPGEPSPARTPTGYIDLAPPRGAAFEPGLARELVPPAPDGWTWYPVAGTRCRDGSESGVFIRREDSRRLAIYFEGGGACTSPGFCGFNPQSANHVLSGTGETVLGSALGAVPGRQQPGVYQNGELSGIFAASRDDNPLSDWNMVYVPYCTGDVHAGTRADAVVPGLAAPQQFLGHHNTSLIVGRLAATFAVGLERVVVTGSSAGSFGAALNFSMISDAFAGVQVDALLDSGAPFDDRYWPPCLQQKWRDLFGLDAALPPDCEQCFDASGGGLQRLADFLMDKHPTARIAVVSSTEDEVIRLFFTPGENECASVETADPVQLTLGQLGGQALYSAPDYTAGLLGLRARYADTGKLATYYFAGPNVTLHQHTWRPRFFEPLVGATTLAGFLGDFLEGRLAQVGP